MAYELKPNFKFREAWAQSTDTPLRFFVHLLFIVEAALALVICGAMWVRLPTGILLYMFFALLGVGVLALILVFILVAFFPKNLIFDKQAHLFERALAFGDESHVLAYSRLMEIPAERPQGRLQSGTDEEKPKDV